MEDEEEKYIAITHFINPHQFWYTCTENDNYSEVITIEEDITKRYVNSFSGTVRHFTPTEGSIVAVQYMPNKKRFLRARVEKKLSRSYAKCASYVVWAIDHGFPFETSDEYIRYLPEEFVNKKIDRVHCGGLAKIVPARDEFDFLDHVRKTSVKEKWNSNACDLLERILTDAASIAFSEIMKSKNGHCWGDLHIVNHRGILFRASDFLINNKYALKNSEKFIEICINSDQTQMPVWESNSGNTKYGKNKCPTLGSMHELDAKACLPNQEELESAQLKIAAWSAHNEKATNYCETNNKENIVINLDDSDLDDSVSKVGNIDEEFNSMHIHKDGIFLKSIESTKTAPKPTLADFGIEEEEEEELPTYEQKYEETSSLDQYSSVSKQNSVSSRSKYLLEMRKKQLSKPKTTISENDSNRNLDSAEIKTDDEAKRSSVSEASETVQKHEVPLRDDESEDKSFVTTNETVRSLGRTRYLNLLRNRNNYPSSSTKNDAVSSTVSSTNSKSGTHNVRSQKVANMVPAGIDLANLNTYRDKNHWHLKRTTRNENQGLNRSQSPDSENQEQDFRFTRENSDKHKLRNDETAPEEDVNLDKNDEEKTNLILEKSVKRPQTESPKESKSFSTAKSTMISKLTTLEEKLEPTQEIISAGFNEVFKSKITTNGSKIQKLPISESSQNSDDSRYSSALSDLEDEIQGQNKNEINSPLKKSLITKKSHQISTEMLKYIPIKSQEQFNREHQEKLLRFNYTDHLVMAHSQIQLYTTEKLENSFLDPRVIEEMKRMFIDKVYRVQSYAWSHMISTNGLFIVNASNSGKTWSYIPPLCTSIIFGIQNCMTPGTYGPVAIIIVPSSENAIEIGNTCSRLLSKFDSIEAKVIVSYGQQNLINTKIQLMETCAILVATPTSLSRLLEFNDRNQPLFDPMRIQYIIVDDIDVIISRAQEDFSGIFKKIYTLVPKISGSKKIVPQLVVTSSKYQAILPKLISISNQPLLLIGDFLEAAVYGRANIEIKLCQREEKMVAVLQFIRKHSILHETLIILCNCEGDVLFVVDQLIGHGIPSIGYHKKSPLWVRQEVDNWKAQSNPGKVLVCSDDVFHELEIQNAQNLIHYSLAKSWTKFTLRFISLINIYENLIVTGFDKRAAPEKRATSLVFLDEENNNELPRLIEFLQNHNQINRIPPEVLKLSKAIQLQRETKRCGDSAQLCTALFECGECQNSRCECRHVLTTADVQQDNMDVIKFGDIRFVVLNVFSPIHFSAHLLEHRPTATSKWSIVRKSNEARIFAMRFNCFYYLEPNNLKMHWPVNVNDLCVFKRIDAFYRARIIHAAEIKNVNVIKNVQIKLKLIDIGEVIHAQSDEVFVCHEQFREFPAQSIDIHLIGVRPYGNERVWDPAAIKNVQNLIKDNVGEKECVYASINFSLSDAIWVDNVGIMEKLPTLKSCIYKNSLKKNLIKKNYGIVDENIVSKVHSLIDEQGFGYILDKTELNCSKKSDDISVVQSEEKFELPPKGDKQNESLDLNENEIDGDGDDCDGDFPQISQGENSDPLASTDKSEILINKSKQIEETSQSESALPAVCNFNELIMCIQRSIALDAKEYIEKDETSAENVQEFLRQTDQLCKSIIAGNNNYNERTKEKIQEIENVKIHEIHKKQKTLDHSKQLQEKAETPSLPRLFNLHERPATVWYQTNYLIILSIHAPDVDDYYMEVTQSYLYFSAYVNGVQQVLILNFLGTIEPSLVSHEMRGLNVAVRLVKSLYVMWPRLVKQEEKMPWLKYNFNMLHTKEMENFLPQQFMHNPVNSNDSDENSVDSDNEYDYYGTFNPIVNKEDFHDPIGSEMI